MAARVGPKKVHRYTVEFKIQAVRLSLHPEIPHAGRGACAGYSSVHTFEVEEGLPRRQAQAGGRVRRPEPAENFAHSKGGP